MQDTWVHFVRCLLRFGLGQRRGGRVVEMSEMTVCRGEEVDRRLRFDI